ncbi:MAG: hypothetical protein JW795_00595 [Chitinivibrionales bacterium]|nr:hypothetical protein [Chitinivibrionales bacterium]
MNRSFVYGDHDSHDKFVNKNKHLAESINVDKQDKSLEKKGYIRLHHDQEASCFNCKLKAKCGQFRLMRSGGTKGAVSFGGDEKFLCDRYCLEATQEKQMSQRQIQSLLKNMKRKL